MGPFDYTIQTGSPFASMQQGYTLGAGIRNDMQAQAEAERKRVQQEEQARQQTLLMNEVLDNPSPESYAKAMLFAPGAREQIQAVQKMRSAEQLQGDLRTAGQVYSAIRSKSPEVAKQLLEDQAAAMENTPGADKRQIQAMRTMSQLVEKNPDLVAGQALAILQTADGGDKILEAIAKGGQEARATELQPSAVAKAEAEAEKTGAEAKTEGVKAKYAESSALLDLEKKGWDIKKVKADIDIAREDNRIKAMSAAIAREGNGLKRQELRLKIEDTIAARDEKIRTKVADVESANANIDNMLNTVDRVLKNPSLNDVLGSLEGRMPGAASMLDDDESDAIALIETLGSQAFLAQIPNIKGMGALSNAEGEKLQSALQNLGRSQSEAQFKASAKEAQRLMMKARKNVADRYGVPNSVPDTPAAQPSASEVDALLKKYGGG